jgi:hypothetical protein
MTISNRNFIFKGGIVAALGMAIAVIAVSPAILPQYPETIANAAQRTMGMPGVLINRLMAPASYVPFATLALCILYAVVTLFLIYYFFE